MPRSDLVKKIKDICSEKEELRLANPVVEEVTLPILKATWSKATWSKGESNGQEDHHPRNGKGTVRSGTTRGRYILKGRMLHERAKKISLQRLW